MRRLQRFDQMRVCYRLLLAFLLITAPARPQTEEATHRETDQLAGQLAGALNEAERLGVLVIDWKPSQGTWRSFGRWLADQFSPSLAGEQVTVLDRASIDPSLQKLGFSREDVFEMPNAIALAKAVGASTLVFGSYGAAEKGIGVTLTAFRVAEYDTPNSKSFMIAMVRGKIGLTQDLVAHMDAPFDSLRPKDGVALAGVGGVSVPSCVKCTPPGRMSVPDIDLVGFLRDKKGAGILKLRFIVTPEGRTTQIEVSRPLGYGFDEQYMKAARDFEFTPAVDADNKPIAVRTHMDFSINAK
jgi:TonB family protein